MAHERERRICRRFRRLNHVSSIARSFQARILNRESYDTRLSIDVSMGLVFRDLRNEDNPGVRAAELDTILRRVRFFVSSRFGDITANY